MARDTARAQTCGRPDTVHRVCNTVHSGVVASGEQLERKKQKELASGDLCQHGWFRFFV